MKATGFDTVPYRPETFFMGNKPQGIVIKKEFW
jgi:hypothetical protein